MRFITTRTHGVLDYVVGIVLILAPYLLGFANGGPEHWIPVILGAGAIVYSLITAYEHSIAKVLPMKTHLALDFLSGAFLATSPWLFGYADRVWVPHVLVGVLEIVASLSTQTAPANVSSVRAHRA